MQSWEKEKMLREEGKAEGIEEGEMLLLISQVCKKMNKGLTAEEIAEMLEEDVERIRMICEAAGKFAPEYDRNKICEALFEEE